MKLFTEIIESVKETPISMSDIEEYATKLKHKLPKDVENALSYIILYNITSSQDVDVILKSSKAGIKAIADTTGANVRDLLDLQSILKDLKDKIKLLPMYMSEEDRKALMNGNKSVDDITLDLDTEKGRQACAKQYASLVVAIASKYKGKSGLDWNGLLSAGQLGLVSAMKDYHKPEDYIDADTTIDSSNKEEAKKQKHLSFKQYAGWRIKQSILNDINNLSRTVRITQYQFDKNKKEGNTNGSFNTISIDKKFMSGDDDGMDITNTISQLHTKQHDGIDANHNWQKIYGMIEKNFSARDASVFYKYFGLNGFKQMKQVEIAKELGKTGAFVSMKVKEVLQYLKSNPSTLEMLKELLEIYSESLLAANYNKSKSEILETFINDDLFIMLEELTHWSNKDIYNNAVGYALECFNPEQSDLLLDCMCGEFNFIDENYRMNKKLYVSFLEHLYPTECIKKRNDVEILNMMNDMSELFKKHNLSE